MINIQELSFALASSKITKEQTRETFRLAEEGIAELTDDIEMRQLFKGLLLAIVAGSFQEGYRKAKGQDAE